MQSRFAVESNFLGFQAPSGFKSWYQTKFPDTPQCATALGFPTLFYKREKWPVFETTAVGAGIHRFSDKGYSKGHEP